MSEAGTIIVAIDGGASRCRLVAFDGQGERLAHAQVDAHASLTLGVGEAWSHIQLGLRALSDDLGRAPDWLPAVLSMGLAGSLQEERRGAFLDQVPSELVSLLVTDGAAQLHGAAGGEPGICLAVGTGSVVHWNDASGKSGMAGGWGFPAGDEASGAWLGFMLLQRYLWHRDGDRCESPLMAVIENTTGLSVSEIQRWTTAGRSREFARLAPSIVKAADDGDSLAVDLLERGVKSLERLLACAPEGLPIYLMGGLENEYRQRLGRRFAERLQAAKGDALDGLYQFALDAASEDFSTSPQGQIHHE